MSQHHTARGAVAMLRDGGVAVAYKTFRDEPLPDGRVATRTAVQVRRFDATGASVLAETEAVSRVEVINSRSPTYSEVQAIALSDGGFVVSWGDVSVSSVNIRTTYSVRRYGAGGAPVTGAVVVGEPSWPGTSSWSLLADAHGGYAVTTRQPDGTGQPFVAVTAFDAGQTVRVIVARHPGDALVLPLDEGRYAVFSSDPAGPYRQVLDSAGNPASERRPITALPVAASELTPRTHAALWNVGGSLQAQRYDREGAALGNATAIASAATAAGMAALAGGGLAAAWSAPDSAGDADVYTSVLAPASAPEACSGLSDLNGPVRRYA